MEKKKSYHFWKELFNQNPVKKRLESSYGSLEKRKMHFANYTLVPKKKIKLII